MRTFKNFAVILKHVPQLVLRLDIVSIIVHRNSVKVFQKLVDKALPPIIALVLGGRKLLK